MAKTDEEDSEYYAKHDANWEEWYMAKERHHGTVREVFETCRRGDTLRQGEQHPR